jgi:nicotinate phosphoribosyltransferase
MLSGARSSGLLADLYELTMAAGYLQNGCNARATFELFVRHLPQNRNYLVAAGLEQAVQFLETVCFTTDEISYLQSLPLFRYVRADFFDFLRSFRFSGDVWAMPEGMIFFPGEPVVRVTAPIAEAQIIETSLLSIVHLQTLVASKAARVTTAAAGRPVIEFGSRRAHGLEAGVLAARAALIAGCAGTSNTYASRAFQVPAYGTQAHSWIMAHEDEKTAFHNFLDVFPEQATLLVDTYDVRQAIDKIIAMGRKPGSIRLDSGDVLGDSLWARRRLDSVGWNGVRIFVSGDLDENRIANLVAKGAPIDAFGVGTALSTSSDAPYVGVIYKLVETELDHRIRGTAKFSAHKKTYPGRKQVFRFQDQEGAYCRDVIALEGENFASGEPLLIPVMRGGRHLDAVKSDPASTIQNARTRFQSARSRLPERIVNLAVADSPYPVSYSAGVEALREQARQSFMKTTNA